MIQNIHCQAASCVIMTPIMEDRAEVCKKGGDNHSLTMDFLAIYIYLNRPGKLEGE